MIRWPIFAALVKKKSQKAVISLAITGIIGRRRIFTTTAKIRHYEPIRPFTSLTAHT
ncbi:hypothetical protein H8E77_14240 [bacterium]|nr:hypothetical protein [bacterium]